MKNIALGVGFTIYCTKQIIINLPGNVVCLIIIIAKKWCPVDNGLSKFFFTLEISGYSIEKRFHIKGFFLEDMGVDG